MRKFLILRSVTNKARAYANRYCRRGTWFASGREALDTLRGMASGDRPMFVVVDGGRGADGVGAMAAGMGYSVETKGVP